jgi:hypothetical protein
MLLVALLAAFAMVGEDILSVTRNLAAARGRGWLAGVLDAGEWLFAITTTTISVTALHGHDMTRKVLVVCFVSAANLAGEKLGQVTGDRFIKALPDTEVVDLETRVAAIEKQIRTRRKA